MMFLYPADAGDKLEFTKIKDLLHQKCRTDLAHERVNELKIHSKLEFVEKELNQTREFTLAYSGVMALPVDFTHNITKELKLLSLDNATLAAEHFLNFKKLSLAVKDILNWYKNNGTLFPYLSKLVDNLGYEKQIVELIEGVIDDVAQVKDTASHELLRIRTQLVSQRNNARKIFESVLRKLNKQGYLADISEGFLNNRRTVAINAEHKRVVKGIFHGESDSQRIVFIEPEETIEINNEINSLIYEEGREIQKILNQLTKTIAIYQPKLAYWYELMGLLDFIRAKAGLAIDMNAQMPQLSAHPGMNLVSAYHPLLLLHNKAQQKPTIPTNIQLNRKDRILIISGPNAGGKTVTMKTIGLLQLMTQAGLLIPASPQSEVGMFKQMMIHIGDTQSIEHELSTYSAHLKDMKYFTEFSNGKTLFFIDELGSGSDPNLGGAFAEAIVEVLAAKHALGVITTHYLNLKVMAGKVPGIINGAMLFDEDRLLPLYTLNIGKPGSSYTFAIAQRTNMDPKIISRARNIADKGHFKLDKMLLQTEQQQLRLSEKEKELNKLIHENEQLKKNYEKLADKELRAQQVETLKLQNKIKKEELDYLREMERKFKQIIIDWKKSSNKQEVINSAEKVLFKKRNIQANQATAKKADRIYDTIGGEPKVGDLIRHKATHQVGLITEIKDKRTTIRIGNLPFVININEWVVVRKKETSQNPKKK